MMHPMNMVGGYIEIKTSAVHAEYHRAATKSRKTPSSQNTSVK